VNAPIRVLICPSTTGGLSRRDQFSATITATVSDYATPNIRPAIAYTTNGQIGVRPAEYTEGSSHTAFAVEDAG
jgi:hypothetical protein